MSPSNTTPEPVGFYCDHTDEPFDARTHHDWEHVEGEGFVFTHQPHVLNCHDGTTQDFLKPEQREQRCPKAIPVYAADDLRITTLKDTLVRLRRLRAKYPADSAEQWKQRHGSGITDAIVLVETMLHAAQTGIELLPVAEGDELNESSAAASSCTAEYGGPGYTRCELEDGHAGEHESAMGHLRRATWGGAR